MKTGDCLTMASQGCTYCMGLGIVAGRSPASEHPCKCVFRAVFRECYRKFVEFTRMDSRISQLRYQGIRNKNTGCASRSWGMPREEFVADFCLIARRTLSPALHKVFKYHYLLGADWKLCCRKLKMERGDFFHMCYRIEERLGLAFKTIQPYALHPVDEYIASTPRGNPITHTHDKPGREKALKAPLRKPKAAAGNVG